LEDVEFRIEALLFLAKFYKDLPGGGPVALYKAEQYCRQLFESSGREKEEAKNIWKEIRERQS